MGKEIYLIAIVLLIISGCVSQQPPGVTPTPTRVQPTAVPTPTATLGVTPSASVEVLNAPTTAEVGRMP